MIYFSFFAFAILPSFIWLLYFLKEDKKPEPKSLLLLVFLMGACLAFIGHFLQVYFSGFFEDFENISVFLFYQLIVISFLEEFLKYLAFFFSTKKIGFELDEPIDLIIYMITAAMGFAALENFIYLMYFTGNHAEILYLSVIRFISATLLHALASGFLGLFLVYAYKFSRKWIIFVGLLVATIIHGVYNIFVIKRIDDSDYSFLFLLLSLFVLLLILMWGIRKVKKMKSICISE